MVFIGDYSWVMPGLAQGSIPVRSQTEYYSTFDTVVLCVDPSHTFFGSFVPNNIHTIYFDIQDLRTNMAHAFELANVVARDVCSGKSVLVACASGYHRSGAFCSLVLHSMGMPMEYAIDTVLMTRCLSHSSLDHVKSLVDAYESGLASKSNRG